MNAEISILLFLMVFVLVFCFCMGILAYIERGSGTHTHMEHEYVDLGLPSGTRWATCNVGASNPEEFGDYFAWGETEPKTDYSCFTYKWYRDNSKTMITKYCSKYSIYRDNSTIDNKTTLDLEDDAAHALWSGDWRMPTFREQEELVENCIWSWIVQNGVEGYEVTSITNGNSIFLPAAGWREGTEVISVGFGGLYWSSETPHSDSSGISLTFNPDRPDTYGLAERSHGYTIRPVFSGLVRK